MVSNFQERIYFEHLRTYGRVSAGVVTIAFRVEVVESQDDVREQTVFVRYGCGMCSPKDKFCKRTGRELAVERLNDSPRYLELPGASIVDMTGDSGSLTSSAINMIVALICCDIPESGNFPNWLRKNWNEFVKENVDEYITDAIIATMYKRLVLQRAF